MTASIKNEVSESLSSFSEEIVDKIIAILEVDAYAPFQEGPGTIKEALWSQLRSFFLLKLYYPQQRIP